MDQYERNLRQAAAAAFTESLEQLEERLLIDDGISYSPQSSMFSDSTHRSRQPSGDRPSAHAQPTQPTQHRRLSENDLKAFAEAAEEIERFMQARH